VLEKSCTERNRLIPRKKYGIYESVVAFLIVGSLHLSAWAVGKKQKEY